VSVVEPDEIAERSRRIREAMAASTEVTSEDHAVTVVVGPGGAVRHLSLSSRAFRYRGRELGDLIVQTIREANARMRQELSETMADIMGDRRDLPTDVFAPLPSLAQVRAELDPDGGEVL
jgi:DNA-binding protein YbaB